MSLQDYKSLPRSAYDRLDLDSLEGEAKNNASNGGAMIIPFFSRMRTRLILLVLLPVIPALALAVYTNFAQRRVEKARVREGAVALAQLADLRRCYELGCNAYVVKPVNFQQFADAIKKLGCFWAVLNEPPPPALNEPLDAKNGGIDHA